MRFQRLSLRLRTSGINFLIVLLVAATPGRLAAQCPFDWQTGDPVPGINGPVNALLVYDDGTGSALYVAGKFTLAQETPTNNIARWDGVSWSSLGTGVEGQINALAVHNNSLIAAGAFTTAGGASASNIARWDGIAWTTLGTGTSNSVQDLTVFNGDLIAAGSFTSAGGASASRVARWNGNDWSPLGAGMNNTVRALRVWNDQLVAGGYFTSAGSMSANHIAVWNGSDWSALGGGLNILVSTLAVYNDEIVAGGTSADATIASVWSLHSGNWTSIGTVPFNCAVLPGYPRWASLDALTVYNGELILATSCGNTSSKSGSIARWNGSAWSTIAGLQYTYPLENGGVRSFVVYQNQLVVGGSFPYVEDQLTPNLAVWDGQDWSLLGIGTSSTIYASAVYNNELIVAGTFTHIGKTKARRIARWDGTTWQPLGGRIDAGVLALAVYGNELIAAGVFGSADGHSVSRIARWNGSSWSSLGAGLTRGSQKTWVYALAVYRGNLIAAGVFDTAGGVPANSVAAWNGASWSALGNGLTGSNPTARALTVYHDELIAGGLFTMAGDVAASRIARWDGSAWSSLSSGLNGSPGEADALTVYHDDLIVGGKFDFAGGVSVDDVARWNGTSWSAFGNLQSSNVSVLTVYNDELIAGGLFQPLPGSTNSYDIIARSDGVSWLSLGGGLRGQASIFGTNLYTLTSFDGQLIAGGAFTTAGANVSHFLARGVAAPGLPQILQPPANQTICPGASVLFNVLAGCNGPFTYQWQKDQTDLSGNPHYSGVNSPTLTISTVEGSDAGSYRCIVNNADGSTASNNAILNLYPSSDSDGDGTLDCSDGCPKDRLKTAPDSCGCGVPETDSDADGVSDCADACPNDPQKTLPGQCGCGVPDNSNCSPACYDWKPPIPLPTLNTISAIATYNGDLIAAGSASTTSSVTRWNGTVWSPLGGAFAPTLASYVRALAVYNGDLIVGGYFTSAGGVSASCIALWNGTTWSSLGAGVNIEVDALAVYNGDLYVGGRFNSAGGMTAYGIAKWNGTSWASIGNVPDIYTLAIYNGELIAGGNVSAFAGLNAHQIARWNDVRWASLNVGLNGQPNALALYNGELIAGGLFTSAGGVSVNNIARWDGSTWRTLNTGLTGSSKAVYALAAYNGELIASGDFITAGGSSANHVAAWNGTTWRSLSSGLNSAAGSMTIYKGDLFFAGGFTTAGSISSPRLARWGLLNTDSDHDGVPDCADGCPSDPQKAMPGICGCGIPEGACRTIAQWRSVRSHNGTSLPIVLNPTTGGNGIPGPTVESRQGGITSIEIDFNGPVTLIDPSQILVTGRSTTAGVLGAPASFPPTSVLAADSHTLVLTFSPALPDASCYTIEVKPTAIAESLNGDRDANVRALVADATGSGEITLSDAILIQARLSADVSLFPQLDVDLNGAIDPVDVLIAKTGVTSSRTRAICP